MSLDDVRSTLPPPNRDGQGQNNPETGYLHALAHTDNSSSGHCPRRRGNLSSFNRKHLSNLYPFIQDIDIPDNDSNITICHVNICSIRNKINEIACSTLTKFSCIAFTETWADASIPNKHIELEGFKMYRLDRGFPKQGGGIIIYVKQSITAEVLHQISTPDIEGMWLKLQLKHNDKPLIVGCVYRRPKASIMFDEKLEEILQSLPNSYVSIVVGDTNYDSIQPTSRDTIFFNSMEALGYKQLVTLPTRVTDTSESLIDHIFTNNKSVHIKCTTVMHDMSDHFATYTTLNLCSRKSPRILITRRNYKNFSDEKFLEYCCYLPFYKTNEFTDINDKIAFLTNLITNVLDYFAALKTYRVRGSRRPWITHSLLKLISLKNRMYKLINKGNCAFTWDQYKTFRNQVSKATKNAKRLYIVNQIDKGYYSGNKVFNLINSITDRNKTQTDISLLHINNDRVTDSQKIANALNAHFANIGKNVLNDLSDNKLDVAPTTIHERDKSSNARFSFKLATVESIHHILENLQCKKGPGLDGISNRILRLLAPWLSEPLTDIINTSLQRSVFPHNWKQSKVTPVFKHGSRTDVNNYRPISITPALSRILEKVVDLQLGSYIESNELLTNRQYGFRKNYSCYSS